MIILGIDPGINGGMCWINKDKIIKMCKIPIIKIEGRSFVDPCITYMVMNSCDIVVLEKQWGMPGDSPMTAFSIGAMFSSLYSCIYLAGADVIIVPAVRWQSALLGKRKNKGPKRSTKERAFNFISNVFPNETFKRTQRCSTPDEGLVDSACIAYYYKTLAPVSGGSP